MMLNILATSIATILGIIVIFFLFWKFIFLRDPERTIPEGNNIVAPADGRIIKILEINKNEIEIEKGFGKIKTMTKDIAENCYVVSIFMSPFNVHINRAPIEGVVTSVKHTKGKFLNAETTESTLENEKNEIIIQNKKIKVKTIQIAGLLARRIECFVKENQKVDKGERIGLINLGSQVTIIMPNKVALLVREGQKTKAGETVIAEY